MALPTFQLGFINKLPTLSISSDFKKRQLPGESQPRMHHGVDIAIPSGTPIYAPVDGKIVNCVVQYKEGQSSAGLYLNLVFTADDTKYYVLFMHLHETKVTIGTQVKAGDLIALSGGLPSDGRKAGSSRGAHLHLEVRRGTNSSSCAIDPKIFLLGHTLSFRTNGSTRAAIPESTAEAIELGLFEIGTQTSGAAQEIEVNTDWSATEYAEPKKKKVTTNGRLAPGIWQIIKLVMDSSVVSKQVINSGITTQTGSLLNFVRNICQEPMVEFSGDTFGNQYYWMIRRPPFDREGMKRMMESTMLTISDTDVMNLNLSWNSDNVYSWYQYIPYSDLGFIKENRLIVPAVFFPQFAQIWGSKPLSVQSNYYSYEQSGNYNKAKKENADNNDIIVRNAIDDFKYIIESNAYLAFTRRGTITMRGDRRIKRGTLVFLETTGEVYYVDSVSNSMEVRPTSRVTTLQVSHGIYPAYIDGKEINVGNKVSVFKKKFSYFDIIDWGDSKEKITTENWQSEVSKWKVNEDNFNFFISKQQVYHEHISSWFNYNTLDNEVIQVSQIKE